MQFVRQINLPKMLYAYLAQTPHTGTYVKRASVLRGSFACDTWQLRSDLRVPLILPGGRSVSYDDLEGPGPGAQVAKSKAQHPRMIGPETTGLVVEDCVIKRCPEDVRLCSSGSAVSRRRTMSCRCRDFDSARVVNCVVNATHLNCQIHGIP